MSTLHEYTALPVVHVVVKWVQELFAIVFLPDDEFGEKTVSILLDGEESEMIFIDHPHIEMSVSISHFYLHFHNFFYLGARNESNFPS